MEHFLINIDYMYILYCILCICFNQNKLNGLSEAQFSVHALYTLGIYYPVSCIIFYGYNNKTVLWILQADHGCARSAVGTSI